MLLFLLLRNDQVFVLAPFVVCHVCECVSVCEGPEYFETRLNPLCTELFEHIYSQKHEQSAKWIYCTVDELSFGTLTHTHTQTHTEREREKATQQLKRGLRMSFLKKVLHYIYNS